MKQPYSIELMLFNCAAVESFGEAVSAVKLMLDQGIVLVEHRDGADQAADTDVSSFLAERHFDFEAGAGLTPSQLTSPSQARQIWGGRCARANAIHGQAKIGLTRRLNNVWDVDVHVAMSLHQPEREPLTTAATQWSEVLDRIGSVLYERVRPELGVLFASKPSDTGELTPYFLRRRLFVGWRTWYGPAYVEAFGRDTLLGLPDRTEPLGDGGVYHALDVDPLDLVAGKQGVYAAVLSYLEEQQIRPAWPRVPRSKSGAARPRRSSETRDESAPRNPEELQEVVQESLSMVAVLTDRTRVLMLPLPWSVLRESERAIVFRHLLYAVQSQVAEHPDAQIRVELAEIPPDLWTLLEEAYPLGGPVTFGLLTDSIGR